jgi:hypothetical protein
MRLKVSPVPETPRPEMYVATGSFYAFSGGLSTGIRQVIICEPLI